MHISLQNGYIAEEEFALMCLKKNIQISRPLYNVEAYDYVIRVDNIFYAIQIKKAFYDRLGNRYIIDLKSRRRRTGCEKQASILMDFQVVDYVAAYILDKNDWYIIPCSDIKNRKSKLSITENGKYLKYKNNWTFNYSTQFIDKKENKSE